MKKKIYFSFIALVTFCNWAISQTSLGKNETFLSNVKKNLAANTAKGNEKDILLKITNDIMFKGKINFQKSSVSSEYLIGEIKGNGGSFYLDISKKDYFV